MATTGTPPRRSAPAAPPPGKGGNGSGRRRPPPRRRKKRNPVWQAIVTFVQAVTVLVLVGFITVLIALGLQLRNAPSSIDLTFDPPGRTLILSSDGVQLARLYTENRQVVLMEQIPKDLQNGTVAFEDKRFYTHSGIDLQGILRALGRNLKSRDLTSQGGSTITQQLARNMGVEGLNSRKSFTRKLHEMLVAAQIEKSYTKQRILEMYLNQVYYGSGAYGVQAAAQTYFGKDVSKLDLAQCALLAGLPNQPTNVSPYRDKKAAEAQRNRVLDNMLEQHYITSQQYTQARAEYIHLAAPKPPTQGSQISHAPYFVNYVVDQLKRRYGEDYLTRGNLKVYTTLNWAMQQAAEDALVQGIARAGGRGPTQGALVALDPKTGEIKAMVGGVDYKTDQFNMATQARRQPGSSFKAVIYSAAIDSRVVTEDTRVYDAPITYPMAGGDWTPKDDDGYSYRHVTLREAMAQSINVPAVKVIKLLGPQTAVRYARVMGVTSPLDPVLSLALGSSGVTPLEMADVYATLAAGGNHPETTPFTRLADLDDKTIEDIPPAIETHVLQPQTVSQLDDMLRAVVTDGTGKPVGDVPDARGKTGTTQGHKDVWFVGYDPHLVCAVWAGHPVHKVFTTVNPKTGKTRTTSVDNYGQEMAGNAWGMTVCAPIWRDFMLRAVPIFQTAMAKEAARARPAAKPAAPAAVQPAADTTDTTPRRFRERRHLDNAAPADTSAPPSDAMQNADGTTTVTVDDNTGLLAPPGAAHSHRETFAPGAAPTVLSPEYDTGDASAPADTSDGTAPAPRRRRHAALPGTGDDSLPGSGDNAVSARPAPPPKPKPVVRYVTVHINPDDGLLATQWTPQYVEKTFVKGQEPKRYSHMYGPPPGEH